MNLSRTSRLTCLFLTLTFLGTWLLAGCRSALPAFSDQEPSRAAGEPAETPVGTQATNGPSINETADRIQPGVKLTITFSGTPNPPPKHEEKVREDGNISPPYIGRSVKAAGKTIGQLQEELQNDYVPAYFARALTVTVTAEERWFHVGGEVRKADRYLYSGQTTVLRAIQTAGDFTDFAKRTKVQITRASGRKETVNCDKAIKNPKLDPPIYPGDQIFVPRRYL